MKSIYLLLKGFFLFSILLVFACEDKTMVAQEENEKEEKEEIDTPYLDESMTIGTTTGKKVASFLTGTNAVYSHEIIGSWDDGTKTKNLSTTGISAFRYPGGHVVSFWDWEFPYHDTYKNFWEPNYESTLDEIKRNQLKEQYKDRMVLEDYLEICSVANMKPVVGINMFQGWRYDRTEESIAKAVRLVGHCLSLNPNATYFFLDNEAGHQPEKNNHVPIDDYIQLIPGYSQAIKAIYPQVKLIPNIMHWHLVEKLIRDAGQYWDIFDQHWYYNSGKWAYFDLGSWRNEVENRDQIKRISDFKKWKTQYGQNHLELSYLEWNGPPPSLTDDSNPAILDYTLLGLIQADQLMFFAKNEIHMATAWPLTWHIPTKDVDLNAYNRNLMDRDDSSWLSPSATIFKAFSYVQGGEILENNNKDSNGLRVLSVKRDQGKGYAVLIINKTKNDKIIEIKFPVGVNKMVEGKSFSEGTGTHNVEIEDLLPELKDGKTYPTIKGTSFAYLLFE
tara:strand:+ start:149 stop:1657 length:1509 start_codon:yes stop_codon:yes gene_type:complete